MPRRQTAPPVATPRLTDPRQKQTEATRSAMDLSKGITPEQLKQDNPYLGDLAKFGPIAIALGLVLIGLGWGISGGSQRFFFSYIHNYVFFMSISIGALLFTLVNHVARASWSVVIRRILVLGGLALLVRRLLRGGASPAERASVGYADGSSVTLEPGAPGFDALVAAAREALLP